MGLFSSIKGKVKPLMKIDTTLTQSGQAADAQAVGDRTRTLQSWSDGVALEQTRGDEAIRLQVYFTEGLPVVSLGYKNNGVVEAGEDENGWKIYNLFGEHNNNKPSGTYIGTGATNNVSIGGVGKLLLVTNSDYGTFFVTVNGAVRQGGGELVQVPFGDVSFAEGMLYLKGDSTINENGKVYEYWLI